jgi:hypothetical protein
MNKLPLRMTALVACLFSGLAAHAVPLTYDFAGTGSVCTFASDASCASTYEGAFTGSVTIDVLANGPSGPDSFTNGSTLAYDYDGWLQSDFLIQWDGNSFNPGPVDSQIASDNYVQLVNGYIGAEQLFNREAYRGFDGSTNFYSKRWTHPPEFRSLLVDRSNFSGRIGPCSGPGRIQSTQLRRVHADGNRRICGLQRTANLSSFTVRATSVPEPGTLVLFGLGLIGLGLVAASRSFPKTAGTRSLKARISWSSAPNNTPGSVRRGRAAVRRALVL